MKQIELIYTREFINDFQETVNFIKKDKPSAAKRFALNVNQKIKLLKSHPELGRSIDDKRLKEIRALIIGNYIVLYEIDKNEAKIYLHGFCNGARDYATIYKELKRKNSPSTGNSP
ncbi:type II toxin-antitoxin system RelE/ParE family toxin [candidate division KSB1 bacterium]|nr:type II toxin-antitoxin system RelE/ParE family toxin [candidate division KSB1 bacterium]